MPSPTTNPISSRIAADLQAALQSVGNAMGALRATAQGTLSPIFTLTSALRSMGQAAAAGGAIVGIISNQFAKLTATMGALAAGMAVAANQLLKLPLAVLEKSIASVGNEIGRFVKLAQPGVFQRFELSVRDLYASIGIALIPVLEKATQIFRVIGSAIYSLTANGQKSVQVFAAMSVAFVTFGAVMAGIAVAAVVGTVALKGFAAAMALVQAIASGGALIPVLAAIGAGMEFVGVAGGVLAGVLGALSGVMVGVTAVATDLTPILNQLAKTFVVFMDTLGGAFKAFTNSGILQSVADTLGEFAAAVGGVIKNLAPAFAVLLSSLAPIVPALGQIATAVVATIGSVGPVVAALMTSLGKFIPVVGQIVAALTPAIGTLMTVLGEFTLMISEVVVALGTIIVAPLVAAIMAVGKVFEALRPILDSFTVAFTKVFVEVGRVVFEFVKVFGSLVAGFIMLNPVTQLFISGVKAIGKALEVVGAVAEAFGDAFTNVFDAMGTLISELVVVFGELMQSFLFINPVLELTLNVVKTLGVQFAALALVISDMVVSVIGWVREFLGIAGLSAATPKAPKAGGPITDNTGAAATSATTGDPRDALRKARESAFQMGTGEAKKKPEEQTAQNTDEIKKAIQDARTAMGDFIKNLPGQIETYINTGVTNLITGVGTLLDKGLKITNPLGNMPGGKPTGTALDNLPPVSLGGVIAEQLKRLNPFS